MLTSMSRIIGCFTVSVSTLFAIACRLLNRVLSHIVCPADTFEARCGFMNDDGKGKKIVT